MHLAAIDIGSNAIRLLIKAITQKEEGYNQKKKVYLRLPVRLGEDAFSEGKITKKKREQLEKAIASFAQICEVYDVKKIKAYATSALREASNNKEVIDQIKKKTKINIELISGEKEAKIIHNQPAITSLLEKQKNYLYVDVGGGSTELSLFENNKISKSKSFKLGTVRILKGKDKKNEWENLEEHILKISQKYNIHALIGTGGTVNKYNKIINSETKNNKLKAADFIDLYNELKDMSAKKRMLKYDLNPDRADVIEPAGKIFSIVFSLSGAPFIYFPKVGLADGMIQEILHQSE